MTDILKLAFVGCGAISAHHLDAINESAPRIKITAAIDPSRDRANAIATQTGAQVFESLEQGLDHGDFDAVDIMLPHDLHEQFTLEALRAGKHILLEKPIAPTLESAERILAAAQQVSTVFMVGENTQYWPEVVKAQQLIKEGAIGDIITARACFIDTLDDCWYTGDKPWRNDKQRSGGGIVIDGGAHWIRPLRMWLGEIDQVIAVLDYPDKDMQGESLARALLRFESGIVAGFDAIALKSPFGPQHWWRVTASQGELAINGGFEGGLMLFNKENPQGRIVQSPTGYFKSFGPQIADFEAAVLDGKALEAGPEQALGELRTALAIYRSAKSNQWEKVWQ